jgi:hypothetical protein
LWVHRNRTLFFSCIEGSLYVVGMT